MNKPVCVIKKSVVTLWSTNIAVEHGHRNSWFTMTGWWFGTWILWLSISWECHNPNWLTVTNSIIFQRGRWLNHQPDDLLIFPTSSVHFTRCIQVPPGATSNFSTAAKESHCVWREAARQQWEQLHQRTKEKTWKNIVDVKWIELNRCGDCISTYSQHPRVFFNLIVCLCETSLSEIPVTEISEVPAPGTRFEIKPTVAPTGKEVPVLPFELSSKDWPGRDMVIPRGHEDSETECQLELQQLRQLRTEYSKHMIDGVIEQKSMIFNDLTAQQSSRSWSIMKHPAASWSFKASIALFHLVPLPLAETLASTQLPQLCCSGASHPGPWVSLYQGAFQPTGAAGAANPGSPGSLGPGSTGKLKLRSCYLVDFTFSRVNLRVKFTEFTVYEPQLTNWECHNPNWRTHIFQRGRWLNHQPELVECHCHPSPIQLQPFPQPALPPASPIASPIAMGCCGSSPVIGTLEVPQGIEQLLGQKKEVASDVAIFETWNMGGPGWSHGKSEDTP